MRQDLHIQSGDCIFVVALTGRVVSFALLLLIIFFAVNSHAQQVSWETAGHQFIWQSGQDYPDEWRVRGEITAVDDNSWISIITEHDGELLSRHLHVTGLIDGQAAWFYQVLADGVLMQTETNDGAFAVSKRIIKDESDYRLRLVIELINQSSDIVVFDEGLMLSIGPGLGEYPVEGLGIAESLYSYVQPVALIEGELERFESNNKPTSNWLYLDQNVGWGGLQSRYFALILQPLDERSPKFGYRIVSNDPLPNLPARYLPEAGYSLNVNSIDPGETVQREFSIFAGPKIKTALHHEQADHTALLFAGLWEWMRALCFALLWTLEAIYQVIPNWGIAIILLAVLVRILMYPVARRVLASQVAFAEVQKKIQPEMRRIKQEYQGGEQSEMILDLYKSHGVSPLAGLKPLLIVMIQIPIFVAMFHVLGQAYELREAPFLWIETLAEPDRLMSFGFNLPFFGGYFNLLPFLMAFTTLLTIKLSPTPATDDADQRKHNIFLILMAIGFLLLFYPFPAGMVLYWTMANILHLLQQVVVEQLKLRKG